MLSVVKYFIMKIKLFKYNQFKNSIFGSRKRFNSRKIKNSYKNDIFNVIQ